MIPPQKININNLIILTLAKSWIKLKSIYELQTINVKSKEMNFQISMSSPFDMRNGQLK